jgi:beta-phosphoglucomutase
VELVAGFLGSAPSFIPNFPVFFESIRGGLRVALATGMDDRLVDAVVGGLRLRDLFGDVVVTSSDVATSKPAPDLFLRASARLGVPPEACVVFEDSPLGIEAAHRAGMACVALTTTYEPEVLRDAEIIAPDWLSLVVPQPFRKW